MIGGAAVVFLATLACGRASPAKLPDTAPAIRQVVKAPAFVRPARLMPTPSSSRDLRDVGAAGDERHIVYGMRVVVGPHGTLRRANELLPKDGGIQSLSLPERFGDGYLFHTTGSGSTWLWRSKTWTGELEPLANLPFGAESVVPGFDRIYVRLKNSRETVALDPESGELTDLGPLPVSPTFGAMAFADAWQGAVFAEYRGVLVTFDAGASWRPAGFRTTSPHVSFENGKLLVHSSSGRLAVDPNGVLRQQGYAGTADGLFSRLAASSRFVQPPKDDKNRRHVGPLGRVPLRAALLHGWPDSKKTAIVAHGGALARISLDDGEVLAIEPRALPAGAGCDGVRLGKSFGFVCGVDRGQTIIYSFHPPLTLKPVLEFDGPRYVASSGNGALVIRSSCDREQDPTDASSAYCVVTRGGEVREIRIRGDLGAERVVALRDGRAAVLVPPRHGANGMLTLVDAEGQAKNVRMKLPKADKSTVALLKAGLWLDGFVEYKKGELRGWVTAAGPFVGVKVKLDGTVTVGEIAKEGLDRTLLSGPFGLSIGRMGTMVESTDGGFTWRELDVPVQVGGLGVGMPKRGEAALERGCSPVGCAFGHWLRVGWRGKGDRDDDLPTAPEPASTRFERSRGGRWLFHCAPTGEVVKSINTSPPPRRSSGRTFRRRSLGRLLSAAAIESTSWPAFFGVAPPARAPTDLAIDLGISSRDVQLRGYLWGPEGAAWARQARWQLRAIDAFAVTNSVWSTTATPAPWADLVVGAQRFGHDPSFSMNSSWSASLEPGGSGGVLSIATRSMTEMFVFEKSRSIIKADVPNGLLGRNALSGVVKVGDAWYVGAMNGSHAFVVAKIRGDQVSKVGTYPALSRSGRGVPTLVRNARGNSVGIWVTEEKTRATASSWYVFPIDLESGVVDTPMHLSAETLGRTPPVCGVSDDGWLLAGSPHVAPHIELVGGAEKVRVDDERVRLLATPLGVCVEAMTARASADIPKAARVPGSEWPPSGEATTPLTLVGTRQRSGFRCAR